MPQETWIIDPEFSEIRFRIEGGGMGAICGCFARWRGRVVLGENLDDSLVEFDIDAASLDTRQRVRDEESRSARFLDVERFPTISYRSTSAEAIDSNNLVVHGDLTVRDVTRAVDVSVTFAGQVTDYDGTPRMGFEGAAVLSRRDFGLTWQPALEAAAGFFIGEEVRLDLTIEAVPGDADG